MVALASSQDVTVGGNITNTIQNSGNSFKPISKNSGNVFKNQYHVSVNPEEEEKDHKEDEMNKSKDDVVQKLDLLQRVSQDNQCLIISYFFRFRSSTMHTAYSARGGAAKKLAL